MKLTFLKSLKPILVFKLIVFLLIGSSFSVQAQTLSGITLQWDKEVGCQTYDEDTDKNLFIADIEPTKCLRVCEYSLVTYTLANLPSGATTTWSVTGGNINNSNATTCSVNWGAAGNGSLSFTITSGNTVINKTICIEKVVKPKALFDVIPSTESGIITTCIDQQIDFTNLSTTNNGTSLVSYVWDFGDGNTSTAFEPSHTYLNPGSYEVILTVKNECNCTDTYYMEIEVKDGKGVEILCPTVTCEGRSEIYFLPDDMNNACHDYVWSVIGGQIISQANEPQVEILWDNIDQYGFGYVTFNPITCNIECLEPTTVKVPVVQTNGTIQGISSICIGGQGRYKLPQWPTTDINWEIVGNNNNNLGQIIQTDQRNEVIVEPYATGVFVLRATYTNTLLKCSGEAEFTFKVEEPLTVTGDSLLCKNSTVTYTNSSGNPVDWKLTTNTGTVVTTQNSTDFTYTFNQAGTFLLAANKLGYCEGEQKIITVIETPNAPTGVDGDLFVCPSTPYSYTVLNPDPSSNYIWEVDNGNTLSSNEGDQVNITFDGTLPAEVKVYRESLMPIECLSDPLVFNVNQISIDVEISDDAITVCASSEEAYSAFELGTTNLYTDGDDYTWSFENASPGGIPASSLGSVTNGQGTNMVDITWNNVPVATTVDLVLEVSKCNISPTPKFVQQITINPQTEIELIASPDPVCSGDNVVFTVQPSNNMPLSGNEIITWDYGSNSFTGTAGQTSHPFTMISNSSVNVGQIVTATVTNPSCGQSVTATATVTVLPNPPAIATISSGDNVFCDVASINTTITISSNTTGQNNFQWFDANGAIPNQTSTSLNVTPSMGPGIYTFQATNSNGCVSISNPIQIFVNPCGGTGSCTITETVTNTSSLTACGEITFSGTHTGSSNGEFYTVLGPSSNNYSINGNILTGKPGSYTIAYNVKYNCQQGTGEGIITDIKNVVIPYEPDFSYVVECTANNTFNIDFIDNSIFYAPVTPQNFLFSYKPIGPGAFTMVSYDPILGNFEMSNLLAGTYVFRQQVFSSMNPMYQDTCAMLDTVSLQGVNPNISIEVNEGFQINCHDTPVKFELAPNPFNSSILWDFDDNGAENTMPSTARVFSIPDATYDVTATVTNELGCTADFSTPVTIPEECFFGDITSSPSPAEVCQNETVDITYVPNGDNCPVDEYIWMDGNTPVPGAPHGATLTVSSTGFYWVKVVSADNCEYSSPTQIKPVFKTLPNVKLLGESTVCADADIKYKVLTNASTIRWSIDNTLYSQFNDMEAADFSGLLSSGNYTISVEVTSTNGCTNTASMNITVEESIQNISFNVSYNCTPYEVIIEAVPTPSNPNITYNWSNGESSQTIVVPDGGPYRVTASLGGCSISKEIDIPRHPDSYLWIYPSGCYTACYADADEQYSYLIGPTLSLPSWSWNEYGNPFYSGTNSFQDPLYLMGASEYSSTINTGPCEKESESLDYTIKECDKCDIDIEIEEVYENGTPYCSFTYNVVINNPTNSTFTVTLSDDFNNVLIIPSTFTLTPGTNVLQFTVIPQNPFTSGTTSWTIEGYMLIDGEYVKCTYTFKVDIPKCENGYYSKKIDIGDSTSATTDIENALKVFPNPSKNKTTVHYSLSSSKGELKVYDLFGRSIAQQGLSLSKGEITLHTSTYQAGVYIVVVRQSNGYTMQQKLVIE